MEIIILLIAVSVTIALTFFGIFYWNIKSGQYDDTYTPSIRMLFDDKPNPPATEEKKKTALPKILTKVRTYIDHGHSGRSL